MKTSKNIAALFAALTLSAMAQKISERTAITGSAVDAAADVIGIVDTSAGTAGSKKILLSQFVDIPSFFGSVSKTELLYLDGVTSAIQTQLDEKAPLVSPTFTGTVNAATITASGNVTGANLSGTNTGNQTSIVGITGTKSQFQTAMTDDDFLTLAGTQTITGNKTFTATSLAISNTPTTISSSVVEFDPARARFKTGSTAEFQAGSELEVADGTSFSYGATAAAAHRTALGLGSLATQGGTFSGTSSGTNTGDNAVNNSSAPARRLLTGVGPHTAVAGERLTLNNTSTVARINDPATGTVGQLYTVIIQAGTSNFNGTGQVFTASRLELVRVCNATNVWSSAPSVISDLLQVGSNSWDGSTLTGAQAFSSTTRPTSAGTGTPAATSLITLGDGDARYSRFQEAIQTTAETSAANTTTYVDSTQCALALGVGTYIIETWQQVEGLGSTGSSKTRLRWDGTATASGLIFLANGSTLANLQNLIPILAQDGSRAFNTELAFNYSSNRGGVVQLRFKFVVTVAGTLYIQYAPAVAVSGQTAQISVGSYITAIRTN